MDETRSTHFKRGTVEQWLNTMTEALTGLIDNGQQVAVIGIRRGGVDIARFIHQALLNKGISPDTPQGELNIAFYRDDFSSMGLHPVVGPSQVPFDVTDRHIILVDDVLGTGRTVRAAMNEIFDYGRPARITLAVLVQRTDQELPIRAQVIGQELSVSDKQYISLDADNLEVTVGLRP